MIIAITGTPGTGKSEVAKELAKIVHANLISLTELMNEKKIPSRYDKKRRTQIVDVKDVAKAMKKELKAGTNIIDGHLSHLLRADLVVVLRCRPDLLERRLKKKKWGAAKIRENIEAEVLDAITIEAVQSAKNVVEIDTSGMRPKAAALLINNILNNHLLQNRYRPGRIDWTKKYAGYLSD